ncbi:hypothetical protein MAR_027593 [Mya arenaria]|uniref:Uncharacterized protein n=1 Tax=Mya arenaria TaxID=6604 RepID=A0ABY7ETX3_MYAAR|nr:hypothetical protein MAR_027593 [Mya arenaria]
MARSLNISATAVTANVTNESYEIYRQTYLQIQDLGICAADMSTPNQYSNVWNGFLTIFILILPYGLALTGLCIIYCRGFGPSLFSNKHSLDQDVCDTNITYTIAMISCALYLSNFVAVLSTGEGVNSGARLVFWSTYFVALKTIVYVVTLRIRTNTSSCTCSCDRKCCGCFNKKRMSLAYELSQIEIRRSLTRDNFNVDN